MTSLYSRHFVIAVFVRSITGLHGTLYRSLIGSTSASVHCRLPRVTGALFDWYPRGHCTCQQCHTARPTRHVVIHTKYFWPLQWLSLLSHWNSLPPPTISGLHSKIPCLLRQFLAFTMTFLAFTVLLLWSADEGIDCAVKECHCQGHKSSETSVKARKDTAKARRPLAHMRNHCGMSSPPLSGNCYLCKISGKSTPLPPPSPKRSHTPMPTTPPPPGSATASIMNFIPYSWSMIDKWLNSLSTAWSKTGVPNQSIASYRSIPKCLTVDRRMIVRKSRSI